MGNEIMLNQLRIAFFVLALHMYRCECRCEEVDLVTVNFLSPTGRYCGNKLPPMLMSPGNTAEVHFTSRQLSSSAEGFTGFTAEFKFVTGMFHRKATLSPL